MSDQQKKTILLVDDEKHIVGQVRKFFSGAPAYQLIITTDPKRVAAVLKGAKIELIITDLRMPNVDGYTIIEMARSQDKEIPFVVITAFKEQESTKLKEHGIAKEDVLQKPFEPEELEEKIRRKLRIKDGGLAGSEPVITNSAKIVFIDDEKDLAEVFKETFEEEGFQVNIFGNGKTALDHLRAHASDYHVAIIDIALPGGVNGYEIIMELQKINSKIGIIPISAHYPDDIKQKLQEIGFDEKKFMRKPFDDIPGLMDLVREHATRQGAYQKFD